MARTSPHSCSSMVANAWVVRMRSRKASARNPSPTASVHRNWTRTSNDRIMGRRGSISPVSTALRRAAASRSSSPNVGKKWILLSAPGWCPLRPARCTKRATPFGPPIWTMASTGRKSTPRSSELVQTTALSRPSYRASSTQKRSSLLMLPWCNAMAPARSGLAARIFWYQISDCDRVLVNTSVLAWLRMMSTTWSRSWTPRWPDHGNFSKASGMRLSTAMRFSMADRMMRASFSRSRPTKVSIASSRLPMVAEMPQTRMDGDKAFNWAMANSTCTPRLFPSRSCHSSTTMALRPPNRFSPPFLASSTCRLSGVVIRISGMRRSCLCFWAEGVSPVRTSTVQPLSRKSRRRDAEP